MTKSEHDLDHEAALTTTGFWGRRGAGCLFYALQTGRFLIAMRSDMVAEPCTWGTWGGAVDGGSSPEETVRREVWEEAGYDEPFELIHVHTYKHSSGFVYDNFIAVVEHEFEPTLDEETAEYMWVKEGRWPSYLHFGMVDLIANVPNLTARAEAVSPRP
jgi:8-oxo-dGTP pyrophosphatase MutT (NUDIX family)